jgi:hypothetical protein
VSTNSFRDFVLERPAGLDGRLHFKALTLAPPDPLNLHNGVLHLLKNRKNKF